MYLLRDELCEVDVGDAVVESPEVDDWQFFLSCDLRWSLGSDESVLLDVDRVYFSFAEDCEFDWFGDAASE